MITCDGCLAPLDMSDEGSWVGHNDNGEWKWYDLACWKTGWYTGIEPRGEWPIGEAVTAEVPISSVPCGETVGPIPKLDGAVFTCVKHIFHAGDHESEDGTWRVEPKGGDPVNAPAHYRWLPNGIEVIDITESFGFLLGNVLKYVMRADHKGKPIEDLEKARWYLDREIANRRERDNGNKPTVV